MKILRELLIILFLYFLGDFIHQFFKIPIPGNILGMILLLIGLYTKIIKLEHIENVSKFLLDHLAFFFIPAGVALINSLGLLKILWPQLLIICFISTVVVMVVSGKTADILKKLK